MSGMPLRVVEVTNPLVSVNRIVSEESYIS